MERWAHLRLYRDRSDIEFDYMGQETAPIDEQFYLGDEETFEELVARLGWLGWELVTLHNITPVAGTTYWFKKRIE